MAEIVNLRRIRKARLRAEAGKAAEINRAAFGRTKAERTRADALAAQTERRFEGHRRVDPADEECHDDARPPDA